MWRSASVLSAIAKSAITRAAAIAPSLLDEIENRLVAYNRMYGVSSSPFVAQARKQYRNWSSAASRALPSITARTGTEAYSDSPDSVFADVASEESALRWDFPPVRALLDKSHLLPAPRNRPPFVADVASALGAHRSRRKPCRRRGALLVGQRH
jgi:hypothetical protein